MEAARALPVALLAGGVACLAWGVAHGDESAGVFVIFPFVIGSGIVPLAGGLLVLAGLATLPLAFPARMVDLAGHRRSEEEPAGSIGTGGLILIGPVPIFLGTWRSAPRWVYWLAVAAGLVLLLVVVLWVGGWALR